MKCIYYGCKRNAMYEYGLVSGGGFIAYACENHVGNARKIASKSVAKFYIKELKK